MSFLLATSLAASAAALPTVQQTPPPATPTGTQRGAPSTGGGPPPGSREAMWPAPTAEDWNKPVQITWQRTWQDAVAVSRETGKPIMVAVNMDGEIASEHYAGILYRDPEVGQLFEPYVSVIASVYRHNPRDYDENGNRIPCPRFGCVTCGEHIAMEPIVYDMYLDETRVAPRHIGVELDGTEMYDVFYAFDVVSVLEGIEEGISGRENTELPDDEADRALEDLVGSRRQEHRVLVEQRFRKGERRERMRLLELAEKLDAGAPIELLRLALFSLDLEVAGRAREILSQQRSENAIDLIVEALGVPMPTEQRDMLIAALEDLGGTYPRAKNLAVALRGVESGDDDPEVRELLAAFSKTTPTDAAQGRYEVEARLERASSRAKRAATPLERAEAELTRAEATLRLAVEPEDRSATGRAAAERARYRRFLFRDAKNAAQAAKENGLESWRADAVIALGDHYLGNDEAAEEAIVRAYRAMSDDPEAARSETATSWTGMATLSFFASERVKDIYAAARAKEDWPKDWFREVNAAFELLGSHPLGEADHVLRHHEFLLSMGARRRSFDVLTRGLERFRGADVLHARLRDRVLWSRGVNELDSIYDSMRSDPAADEVTFWHAGYAALVAGEFRRRRSQTEEALASYERAIEDYRRVAEFEPEYEASADHYIAIAKAGQAHVKMEAGQLEAAAELLLEAFETKPDAANVLDGLNASAVTTANTVVTRLGWANEIDVAAKLQAGLDALDEALLAPPDFETPPDTPAARNRDRRGRERSKD